MKHIKKVTMITGIALLISVFSLTLSFGLLGTSNALRGSSIEDKEVWSVNIDNISTMAVGDNHIVVKQEPVVNAGIISYSIVLNTVNDYGQFQFNIKNDGNVSAKVSDIKITGIDDYKEYIDVSLSNLKIGDVVNAETLVSNIKVVTTYKKQLVDVNMWPQAINLENVNIEIEFEKVN